MTGEKFEELMSIMRRLRKECPWDKEQTHDSIKSATIEEAYEVVEAIDEKNFDELKSELGDLLLHIVFHSVMAEEENYFNVDDVITSINEKLVRRHPHIFGDTKVKDSSDIERNWEKIKLSEGRKSVLEGVPKYLQQLQRAFRLQQKASKVGFDWEQKEDVWKKVEEEITELKEAEATNNKEALQEEIGDLFFALVNYSRFLKINPEEALRYSNNKFIKRFEYLESKLKEEGKNLEDTPLEEMDKYWEKSKEEEK